MVAQGKQCTGSYQAITEGGSTWVSSAAACSALVQKDCSSEYKYFAYGRLDGARCDSTEGGCKCYCETETTCTIDTLATYDLYEVVSKNFILFYIFTYYS